MPPALAAMVLKAVQLGTMGWQFSR